MAGRDTRRASSRWRRTARPDHRLPPGRGEELDAGEGRPSIVQLLRSLSEDVATLVRQEIRLAKLEAGRTAKRVAVDGAWITAGAAIVAIGGICLVLALALGLGALLGSYWLGTLITGVLLVGGGALVAWKGVRDLRSGDLGPTRTVETLREDADWARREMREFGDDLKE